MPGEHEDPVHRVRRSEHEDLEEEPLDLRRTTEQGDELTETHSVDQRESRAKRPYRPPRQPSQEQPGERG